MDPLKASLLDLLAELEGDDIPITVGGGFGLYLKRQHIDATGERTLFTELPEPRATNDLDLFIRAEILADLERSRTIADAIRRLGYEPVESAKFMQWVKPVEVGGVTQSVKIDLLVGPLGELARGMIVKNRRARPKGRIQLHARPTEEAVAIDDGPIAITIDGTRTGGVPMSGSVYVPAAFPYLMMKLAAFGDRKDDEAKDLGRHHALDLYTVVGMVSEAEYERAIKFGGETANEPHVRRVRRLVEEDFSSETGLGILRLQEHPLFRADFRLLEFRNVLKEIFAAG